jgi:hypothetical protein
MNHLQTLIAYQAWRRGEDERVFEDIGLTPASIGEALDWAISELDKPEWAQSGDNTLRGAIDHWKAEAAKYKALCRELADTIEQLTNPDPSMGRWLDEQVRAVMAKYKEHTR